MKQLKKILSDHLLALALISGCLFLAVPHLNAQVTAGTGEIEWISFKELQEKVKTEPRKVFVDLYTEWCGWCKVLDKRTYTQKKLIDYLNSNYYSVKFDAEQKESVTFAGQSFKYVASGKGGGHELATALTEGNLSYPTLVFINEKLQPITYVAGFKEADELLDILTFLKEDLHLKGVAFKDYKQQQVTKRTKSKG